MKKVFLSILILGFCVALFLIGQSLLRPSNGQLSVKTKQSSVEVFLDNKKLGQTPFYSKNLKIGDFDLVLKKGSISWKTKVNLTSNTLSLVEADLSESSLFTSASSFSFSLGQKSLLVITKPTAAKILLNNEAKGTSPQKIESLTEGATLTIEKAGYLTRELPIDLKDSYSGTALVYLSADPFGEVKKLDGNSRISLFSLFNKVVDLAKNYSEWAEGVKHTQESFTGEQIRFDLLIDTNGKTYILYPTEWTNKVSTKAVANVGYISKDNSGQLSSAAKSSWETIKKQFD